MKERTWAKWAFLVFFAIIGLLTFFSGTIRNLTLPQITVKPVTAGSITPVVSGAGVTEAGDETELPAERLGIVTERLVQAGDQVEAGAVLLRVEYTDDWTLAALEAQLEQQQTSYEEAKLTASISTDSGAWSEYQILKNNLAEAQARQSRCKEYSSKRKALDSRLSAAEKTLTQAQTAFHAAVDGPAAEAEQAGQDLEAALRQQEIAQTNYDYYAEAEPESEACAAAKTALEEANAAVLACQNRKYEADTALASLRAQYQPPVDAAQAALDELKAQSSALEMDYAGCTDETACENAVLSAKSALSSYYDRQANAKVQDELTAARLTAMETEIGKTEQAIADLAAKLGEREIAAPAAGIVRSIREKDEFGPEETLLTLLSDEAFTLRFSVSLADAALLKLGNEARITNQNGGSRAVLTAMEPDKNDPTNQKTLLFSVTGENAAPAQFLTLAIPLETTKHDRVVPNAAVWQDSVGAFVYVVETKTTPLGSRSKVRRVDVEVLRRDDGYTAVNGELTSQDYVVILSSAPLSDGQSVRFGD